ncbi:MBL fold metallo-hydrolase [Pseudaminobacter arsenicus]|uniref:MBL fold metallo-hydrolase n=1 Tax=Borborobacter arsenicus TaxID=1851146 RepID=A0A432UZ51_9HYPH|nr:MBL fold metallo-hydrolase [Pseudaminobacter arsenicus]RUM95206.1 MBL fold metallo-hydrolase [Pseudaminobacter arsenicus]
MKISFHGAARGVTGSCHLVECAGRRILIDCGLFQGKHELGEENDRPFGFDPAAVDWLLLTHAHLDHCGRMPLLRKRGFTGEIIATSATRDLTRLVLLDAANLQEEEARRWHRRAARSGSAGNLRPLYSVLDALDCMEQFGRTAHYGKAIRLAEGIVATFFDAGHILGSASILLELSEGGSSRRLVLSGDIGNAGRPLISDPTAPPGADAVVMESTYGDRPHRPLPASVAELEQTVRDAFDRGGNVVIPVFALERTQELLFHLRQAIVSRRLPGLTQVFLDSPMAIAATELFRRNAEFLRPEIASGFASGHDFLDFRGLHFTRDREESASINRIRSGAIIMAGSGMCTGGRVLHHLKHNLWRPESAIVFVGYASEGTLGRRIIDGAREVSLLGESVTVRATIHTINGFSAHAAQPELVQWHRHTKAARTFLVHGETLAMTALSRRLHNSDVIMPSLNESFTL